MDDLTTDDPSKRNACKMPRNSGQELAHVPSIFYYDTFVESRRTMEEIGVTMHALTIWQDTIAQTRTGTALTAIGIEKVEGFLLHTSEWPKVHGGISRLP